MRRRLPPALALGALAVLLAGCTGEPAAPSGPTAAPDSVPVVQPTATPEPAPTFDRSARSIDDPSSIWIVVDKLRPVNPVDFVPPDLVEVPVAHTWEPLLRQEAADAVVGMFDAARNEAGLALASNSAYRSYTYQVGIYGTDVDDLGKAAADKLTARPGYSEHQTGLAIDIGAASGRCSLAECFETTPEGEWLAAHAWEYGFVLRYPKGLTSITGYDFEPWHYRYVGLDLAKRMHDSGVKTLEQEFGLGAAPDYPN